MNKIYNKQLIKLWSQEVETLLNEFHKPLELGNFILSHCSAEEIWFKSAHLTLIFRYIYERYHSPIDQMIFDGIDIIIKKEERLSLVDIVRAHDETFNIYEYLHKNINEKRIFPRESYCHLIETHLMDKLQGE